MNSPRRAGGARRATGAPARDPTRDSVHDGHTCESLWTRASRCGSSREVHVQSTRVLHCTELDWQRTNDISGYVYRG